MSTAHLSPAGNIVIRYSLPSDRDAILAFVADTGYFRPDELPIAQEVLDEALTAGPSGHYQSLTALAAHTPVGWLCFGPTPCTLGTFDIYWIAVAPAHQGRGIGAQLIQRAEEMIKARHGRLAVIETSGQARYQSTRAFYLKCGYHEAARVPNFYAPGDDKIIYVKQFR
ncbi:MAG: GNAT family N-acetyltransferase [bacterium]|nr:GNAT family N-acetyltransferase [bacterium]